MIRKNDENKPVIDLTGPEGNSFVLIGYVHHWSKELGIDPAPILADMRSSDYEHLLNVVEKHFGELVVLER